MPYDKLLKYWFLTVLLLYSSKQQEMVLVCMSVGTELTGGLIWLYNNNIREKIVIIIIIIITFIIIDNNKIA